MVRGFWVTPAGIAGKRLRAAMLLTCAFSVIGCATKRVVLVPARNATLATQPHSARASSQGVSILVQANVWEGGPQTLDEDLIAIKVTIQNNSRHEVAVRYEDFALVAADNRRYNDIPPDQIRGHACQPLEPEWAYSDAEQQVEVQLPTQAMLEQAMSEGVVAPGEKTRGFLYFPRPSQTQPRIAFSAILVDAHTKQKFGGIAVPLVVESLPNAATHSASF